MFSSRFDTMIENIQSTVAKFNSEGIQVVLLGPSVQFKTGLPAMIIRALSRKAVPSVRATWFDRTFLQAMRR